MKVEVSSQVLRFIGVQAPEPRRVLKLAIRKLSSESGNIRALDGQLMGYLRLRVRGFRIIFYYADVARAGRVIRCAFVERRSIVYEVFQETLKQQLLSDGPE